MRILTDSEKNLLPTPIEVDLANQTGGADGSTVEAPLTVRHTVLRESSDDDPIQGDVKDEAREIFGSRLENDVLF